MIQCDYSQTSFFTPLFVDLFAGGGGARITTMAQLMSRVAV